MFEYEKAKQVQKDDTVVWLCIIAQKDDSGETISFDKAWTSYSIARKALNTRIEELNLKGEWSHQSPYAISWYSDDGLTSIHVKPIILE